MTNDLRLGVRGLAMLFVSRALLACATPAAQTALSGSEQSGSTASGALAELGSFEDRGVPKGVVLWLRVPAAGRDIPLLGTLTGAESMLDPSEMLSNKLGPLLSRTVDLSRPVDMTLSGLDDDATQLALAVGVGNAKAFHDRVWADFGFVHKARGRWQIVPNAKPAPDALGCELWHAAEPVGARLICATSAALIEQQGEFFMAAARTSVDRANFHAEVPGSAVQLALEKQADEEKHEGPAAGDDDDAGSGAALGRKLVTELARDLSGIGWDLTLQRGSVEISQMVGFSRSDSLLSASLSGRASAPKPVPETFWRLPSDSDVSLYSEGAEPEPMRRLAASWIHDLISAGQTDSEYTFSASMLDQWERALRGTLLRGGAFEIAYGRDLDRAATVLSEAAERARDRGPNAGGADPALKKAQARLGGWVLFGIEDDSQAYLQALRQALLLAADKTKYPRKNGASGPSSPSPAGASRYYLTERPLKPESGLPPEALHVVARSEPNPKYRASKTKQPAPAPSTYHLVAVPNAARHLWLAISPDEGLALARARAVLAPDPAKTLGASDELRQLAKRPLAGIGFCTLAGLTSLGLSAESKADVLASKQTLKELGTLPKRGATRMPIWITRAQLAKGERRISVNLRLTPDAIGDVLATLMALGSGSAETEDE